MQDIQEIFNRIQENKKKQKEIRSTYKEALASSQEYVDLCAKIKNLREHKKQIENSTKQNFSSEFNQMEDFDIDIESDTTLLSDAALTKLMKGETVTVTDEYNNEYEPAFSVKFKKA